MPCGNRHRTCRRRGRGKSAGPGCRTAGGSGITGRRRCRRQVGQPDAIDTPEGANRLLDLIADRMSSPLRLPKTTKIPAPSCFRRSPYSSGWSRCARRRHGNMPTPSERSSRSFGRLSRHAGRVSTRTAHSVIHLRAVPSDCRGECRLPRIFSLRTSSAESRRSTGLETPASTLSRGQFARRYESKRRLQL